MTTRARSSWNDGDDRADDRADDRGPGSAAPVQRVAFLLGSEEEAAALALASLRELWGPVDFEGPWRLFDKTGYYEAEMGPGLRRKLVSFARLGRPEELVEWKLAAVAIEGRLAGPSGRRVNIDPGYLDAHKLVLASLKARGSKLYLGRGVWADPLLTYSRGRFLAAPWTFPDLRAGVYDVELARVRQRYRTALRARRGGEDPPGDGSSDGSSDGDPRPRQA